MSNTIYEKKYNYVYLITNSLNDIGYIGKHSTDNIDDDYLGSSCHPEMIRLKKECREIFTRVILEYFPSSKEARAAETILHHHHQVGTNPKFYNMCMATKTGFDLTGTKHTKEHNKNISVALTNRTCSNEHNSNNSKARKGVKLSKKHCENISKGHSLGTWILPGNNKFHSSTIAAKYANTSGESICEMCKRNNDKIITKKSFVQSKHLQSLGSYVIGKSRKEVGFAFIPA